MHQGKLVFAQLMLYLPLSTFRRCVADHRGEHKVKDFSCLDQFFAMAFAQLTYRESLRDIEVNLRAQAHRLYHMGFRCQTVSRNTLANANATRPWQIYADFAQHLIGLARPLYAKEPFGLELDAAVYAFDASTIDLCLSVFAWAPFRTTKAAIKLHTLLDLRGNIPSFIHITDGRTHEVNVMDDLVLEPGAFYLMDRGYLDFSRLFVIHEAQAFFVTRAKSNTALLNKSEIQSIIQRTGMMPTASIQIHPVPYKHSESRRHKFTKPRYKVTNWPECNAALRRRGDITIWFTEAAINEWRPAKTGARGRPQEYSDHAIETAILIRQVFHLPLRQTEGFMVSLARLMNAAISIPDFSSISKRSIELPRHVLSKALEPGSLVIVDSTGLKVYGQDEWHQEKHGVPARRTWRKLHLAVDENHQILACELTTPEVGDPTAVADLLAQIDTPFEVFMGDGAYDGEPVSRAMLAKQPSAQVVVPPHKSAVYSEACDTQRDEHIRAIEEHGRIGWQKQADYGLRSYIELAIQLSRASSATA